MQYTGFHDQSGLFKLNHSDKTIEIQTNRSQLPYTANEHESDWYCFKENRNVEKECEDCIQEGDRYKTCGS